MEQYGTIRIKLDELIRKAGISKNKLSHRAEMQRTQINHALQLLDEGHTYRQVEAMTGISKSTLVRAKRNTQSFIMGDGFGTICEANSFCETHGG